MRISIPKLLKKHQDVLKFSFIGMTRQFESYLTQGVTNLKVRADRITFISKSYGDPHVVIKFADIQSLRIDFAPHTRRIKSITVVAPASRGTHYENPPGPDL